ncbi:FAD-dependent monooxygenase [Pycnococcus provasolii]
MARRALQAAETQNGGGSRNPSAIVIGAGPAGAAAALALARTRRWDVRVFERRMEAWEASAHPSSWNVTLTRRAFDTLEELGIDITALREQGTRLQSRVILGSAGSAPTTAPMQFDNLNLATWRIAEPLVAEARRETVEFEFGCECLGIRQDQQHDYDGGTNAQVRILNEHGEVRVYVADLVVGADGANSAVRMSLTRSSFGFEVAQDFEGSSQFRSTTIQLPKHAKLGSDRMADEGVNPSTGQLEQVGDGLYNIMSRKGKGAVIVSPNHNLSANLVIAESLLHGATEPEEVRRLILHATPAVAPLVTNEAVLALSACTPLASKTVGISRYSDGAVVLIGDAAHSMLNNLGQGANSALEDVRLLVAQLHDIKSKADIPLALKRFSDSRKRDMDAASTLSKLAFHVVSSLPRKLDSMLYLIVYKMCQRLPFVTPWQTVVATRPDVSYTAVGRLRSIQNKAILLGLGLLFALFAMKVGKVGWPLLVKSLT